MAESVEMHPQCARKMRPDIENSRMMRYFLGHTLWAAMFSFGSTLTCLSRRLANSGRGSATKRSSHMRVNCHFGVRVVTGGQTRAPAEKLFQKVQHGANRPIIHPAQAFHLLHVETD